MGNANVKKKVIRMRDDILGTGEHIDVPVPGDKEKITKNDTK